MIPLPLSNGKKCDPSLNWINQLGNRIQDYRLKEQIGKGGFGEVFKADCLQTGKIVAIKRLNKDNIRNTKPTIRGKLEERVREEISIHYNLDHTSIVQLYKYFQDGEYIYIVLEHCKWDLVKYIQENGIEVQNVSQKRLHEAEARRFLAQVVDGMLYLNKRNILHRDLKLANTLLTEANDVKIADFGLASRMNNGNKTLCGTPNNMSPETIKGEYQSKQTDVWSLGVMLYEMLTGKQPFATKYTKETMKKITIGEYDLPNYLSQDSSDLIKKCLQANPENRISVAQMQYHPFLSPIYKGGHSQDSGLHSLGGSNVQHGGPRSTGYSDSKPKCIQSNLRNIYNPQNSPPVSMKSNPRDLPINPYIYSPMPSLVPPSALLRSARGYGSSMENLGSAGYPMKAVHYRPIEGIHSDNRIENRNVQEAGSELFYKPNLLRHSYQDNGYSNQKNQYLEGNYNTDGKAGDDHRALSHGSRQHSWHEMDKNIDPRNQHYTPSCSAEMHAGILADANVITPTAVKNRQSSITKSHSSREGSSIKDKPPPLSSVRLKKIREVKVFSVLSILEDSTVCIEYIKNKGSNKKRVIEVWKISSDGNNIVVYRPNGKEGLEIGDCPPKEQGDVYRYTYDSLPEKHWNKYSNAYKFAENVKEKTRKIIYRQEEPKACLMENGNVEAEFKNGIKFVFFTKWDSRKGKFEAKVNLTKASHTGAYSETRTETCNMDDCCFNEKDSILFEKCCKMRNRLLRIEKLLSEDDEEFPDRSPFPCYLGSRPTSSIKSPSDTVCSRVPSSSNKENVRKSRDTPRRSLRI